METAEKLEQLLIADLDSFTLKQNMCQLDKIKEVIKEYEKSVTLNFSSS